MTLALVLGVSLVMTGLVLLCHLSYTNLGGKQAPGPEEDGCDVEDPSMGGLPGVKSAESHNDCLLPCCFFQISRVMNHESWIVACLLGGATVLVLGMEG